MVDVFGHLFLAHAALTQQQNRGLGRRHALQQAGHAQEGRRAADQQGFFLVGLVEHMDVFAHVANLAVLAEDGRGLKLDVFLLVAVVIVNVHHLGGLAILEDGFQGALFAVLAAGNVGMMGHLVTVAADQVAGLDVVVTLVGGVGRDDPIILVDDHEGIRHDVDELFTAGFDQILEVAVVVHGLLRCHECHELSCLI